MKGGDIVYKFFPAYLNQGSKGPAVALLQIMLKVGGLNDSAIQIDGDYGEQTAEGVRQFQNMSELEADGNFGPLTREKFKDFFGFDANELPSDIFIGKTICAELS